MGEEKAPPALEARLWALETLVAFLFAAQHMQTPDPASALVRLRSELLERDDLHPLPEDEETRRMALAELERAVSRVVELQERLPRRLVD